MSKLLDGWRLAGALAALALAAPPPARACSVCNCGDPLVGVAEGHGRGDGAVRVGLEAEALSQRAGSESEPGVEDVLDQTTLRLTGVWSPLASLNVVAAVPLVHKVMKMDAAGVRTPVSDLTGVGDVELGARWYLVDAIDLGKGRRHGLALSAGTSVPTGGSRAKQDGARVDQHGQLGTGAWGPNAGLVWRLDQGDLGVLASVVGRYRGENADGYRFGSALLFTVQGRWAPRPWLALGAAVEGRDAGRDREDGAWVENTGGRVAALTPSIHLRAYEGLWLGVRAQVPVWKQLAGEQTVSSVWVASLTYEP
ncbi:MAG: hypothetical protein U0229_10930 [Anaeromyxobacter sp.]